MIVWLLDTQGPRAVAGICDSEAKAISDAKELLADGRASTARVEFAFMHAGGSWLSAGYRRTGSGWHAARADDGTVTWQSFSPLPRPEGVMNERRDISDMGGNGAETDRLIKEWEASRHPVHKVAAGIARKIARRNMHRYENLPIDSALADEWDVSVRTVSAAKRILRDHGILILENRRYYVALPRQPPDTRKTGEAPPMEETTPPPAPPDPSEPYALRMTLIRRYWHLNLKFSSPLISQSGKHEAAWIGGDAAADTQAALLGQVLDAMGDCGSDRHLWETRNETRDPVDNDNMLLTQRLKCAFCDERERVITICHPHPTIAEENTPEERKHNGT